MQNYIEGIFIEECKHRFKCIVSIKGKEELCYVASSCHLSPYVDLKNKTVLLKQNKSKTSKTNYTLYALKEGKKIILLELAYINNLLYNYINKDKQIFNKLEKIETEKKLSNTYKPDILIHEGDQITLIEAKALLSVNKTSLFPSTKVTRAQKQLSLIKELLKENYKVIYWIVLLNPINKNIKLNPEQNKFIKLFKECQELGMSLYISNISIDKNNELVINKFKIVE